MIERVEQKAELKQWKQEKTVPETVRKGGRDCEVI
jgi:hypothetical protein